MFLVQNRKAFQHTMLFHLTDQWIVSLRVLISEVPTISLRQELAQDTHGWTSSFILKAVDRIKTIQVELARDEMLAATRRKAHRPQRDPTGLADHVVLSMKDYTHVVKRCIRVGFTIKYTARGHPEIVSALPTKETEWGYKANALQAAARTIEWPDHELLTMLTFGGYEYSADTPPVSWFALHSASVYRHWPDSAASVRKEIRLGWMAGPWEFVPTVTFQAVPYAAIQKPRQPGKF